MAWPFTASLPSPGVDCKSLDIMVYNLLFLTYLIFFTHNKYSVNLLNSLKTTWFTIMGAYQVWNYW